VLPLTGIKHAIAIDFDPVEELLYWTDEQTTAIRRAPLDGMSQQNVISTEVCNYFSFSFSFNVCIGLENVIYNKNIISFNAAMAQVLNFDLIKLKLYELQK